MMCVFASGNVGDQHQLNVACELSPMEYAQSVARWLTWPSQSVRGAKDYTLILGVAI